MCTSSCWKCDRPAALDLTIVSPLQTLTIQGAATTQCHMLVIGDERKRAAHVLVTLLEFCLSPLVMESLRGWNYEAVETTKAIGHLQVQRLGMPSLETITYTFQQLAILGCGWKGDICMWARRVLVRSPIADGVL